MVGVYTDRGGYSLLSATNTAAGSAVDLRAREHSDIYAYVTGGSAVLTLEASHSLGADSAWLPVITLTATNNSQTTAAQTTHHTYLRGHSSGYVGATASLFIAAGIR